MADVQKSASVCVLTSGFCALARPLSCHRVLHMETEPAPEVIQVPPGRNRSGSAAPLGSGGTQPPQVPRQISAKAKRVALASLC